MKKDKSIGSKFISMHDNKSALVLAMAWCLIGHKPLPEITLPNISENKWWVSLNYNDSTNTKEIMAKFYGYLMVRLYLPHTQIMINLISYCGSSIRDEQGKSQGFDSCDRPSYLTQIGFKLWIFRPCDLEIWWMTTKNNKAHLLYNIKLCVSFHIHQWIQIGVTVQKRPIWVKLADFLAVCPCNLTYDLEKQ